MSNLVVESGLIGRLGEKMRAAGLTGRAFVVSDEQVFVLYGESVLEGLRRNGFEADSYRLVPGEASKALASVYKLYDWLVENRVERIDAIVALGGGVVGDIAGFAAATILRGIPLVQVPTTILAQIDSSIGGKVGVDHPKGKNLIGAFYPARLIAVDTDTLRTLPRREIAAGWAEAIKCALILDAELLDVLEANAAGLVDLSSPLVPTVVERCGQHKVQVVTEDERETGLRMILNYGHTIGHALEAVLNYDALLHGEAVSIGMAGAAQIALAKGLIDQSILDRQNAVLAAYGLPVRYPDDAPRPAIESIMDRMARDKKSRGAVLRWILIDRIGHAVIDPDVPLDLVRDVVASLLTP